MATMPFFKKMQEGPKLNLVSLPNLETKYIEIKLEYYISKTAHTTFDSAN